jgi:hypothetical protein
MRGGTVLLQFINYINISVRTDYECACVRFSYLNSNNINGSHSLSYFFLLRSSLFNLRLLILSRFSSYKYSEDIET